MPLGRWRRWVRRRFILCVDETGDRKKGHTTDYAASAWRLVGSVPTSHRQRCPVPTVGARSASASAGARHARTTAGSTGWVKSSRLRTERVGESSPSGVRVSSKRPPDAVLVCRHAPRWLHPS